MRLRTLQVPGSSQPGPFVEHVMGEATASFEPLHLGSEPVPSASDAFRGQAGKPVGSPPDALAPRYGYAVAQPPGCLARQV